jgi:hypothetical protein
VKWKSSIVAIALGAILAQPADLLAGYYPGFPYSYAHGYPWRTACDPFWDYGCGVWGPMGYGYGCWTICGCNPELYTFCRNAQPPEIFNCHYEVELGGYQAVSYVRVLGARATLVEGPAPTSRASPR